MEQISTVIIYISIKQKPLSKPPEETTGVSYGFTTVWLISGVKEDSNQK